MKGRVGKELEKVDPKLSNSQPQLKFADAYKKKRVKLSTMVGENFEICISEMSRNALKLSTMVGENFEICISEMSRNALKTVHNGCRKF